MTPNQLVERTGRKRPSAHFRPLQPMADASAEFEQELEVLRTEAEAAAQFFYSYLTIHAVAGDHRSVYRLLNGSALFWNTILAGLQTSTFIVLGRILDQSSAHN